MLAATANGSREHDAPLPPQTFDEPVAPPLEAPPLPFKHIYDTVLHTSMCLPSVPEFDGHGLYPGSMDLDPDFNDAAGTKVVVCPGTPLRPTRDVLRKVGQSEDIEWAMPQLPSCGSRAGIRCIGTHSSYACGTQRPFLRGWLHASLSVLVFPWAVLALMLALLLRVLPSRWVLAEVLLVGKGLSYGASSVLHLYPFQGKEGVRLACVMDLLMISVSVGVSPCPFILQIEELVLSLAIHATFVLITGIVVMGKRERLRSCLILIQFIFAMLQGGLHVGFASPVWLSTCLAYFISFVCYKQKTATDCALPWHRAAWYGWHEDFHVLLLCGDVLAAVGAVQFLSDPSMDRNPNFLF